MTTDSGLRAALERLVRACDLPHIVENRDRYYDALEQARAALADVPEQPARTDYYYPPGTTGIVPPGIDPETGMRWSRDRDPFLAPEQPPAAGGLHELRCTNDPCTCAEVIAVRW